MSLEQILDVAQTRTQAALGKHQTGDNTGAENELLALVYDIHQALTPDPQEPPEPPKQDGDAGSGINRIR